MDTSAEYIKMCEKAVEVQEESGVHPLMARDQNDGVIHFWDDSVFYNYMVDRERTPFIYHSVWLPRQDQLQEIHGSKFVNQGIQFFEWASEFNPDTYYLLSWEQLWLGFVMKEKYGKTWAREDWK